MLPSAVMKFLPTPQVADATGSHKTRSGSRSHELLLPGVAEAATSGALDDSSVWGEYKTAIHHQESITRPAPPPTEPNSKGNQRLSARFAEWLMMWPDGWVTDTELGLSRNQQLKLIGNGVVPNQAVAAFGLLLDIISSEKE